MHLTTRLLIIAFASSVLCTRAFAQSPPPTQDEVQTALTQQNQQKTAIKTLEARIAALGRATVLLSRDDADHTYLESVRSMLAESKRQLETARKDYSASLDVLKDAEVTKP